MPVIYIEDEVLTAFCPQCKCCLPNATHCGTCHVKKSIATLCGCGECVNRAQDYIERDKLRAQRRALDKAAKAAING